MTLTTMAAILEAHHLTLENAPPGKCAKYVMGLSHLTLKEAIITCVVGFFVILGLLSYAAAGYSKVEDAMKKVNR